MELLRFLTSGVILIIAINGVFASDTPLPQGDASPPVKIPHFPDRLHAFVWWNWNVVEPAKLAKVVGTSKHNIVSVAKSMGLPGSVDVPPEMRSRGYITIIRRNWHLLPYEQLLELLDMTPEQLNYVLREDDALWIKLGMLKPKCDPLRYNPPDGATQRRASEIKRLVQQEFGEAAGRPVEPRFHFLKQFAKPIGLLPSPVSEDEHVRFIYSYFAVYGDPLLNPEIDPYPDGLLERLAALGVNGVWLHVVLRDLAPAETTFPEFGIGHQQRLKNLRALVGRAKAYGIGIYLYMNEPRGMPEEFFMNHPEVAGARNSFFGLRSLCTSHPKVQKWMRDSLAYIFREVPDLAGVFTITGSENVTNCASHGGQKDCPRCKNRTAAEIIAEVNAIIEQSVHRGNPKAKVLVWDWGWYTHGNSPDIIARLPKSVWFMSVSEWGKPLERGVIRTAVNEYSISAVGPGPRAMNQWRLAKASGRKTVAKVQLNNTWELSTVPYLPVMDLVAEHCHNLASNSVDGMMLSWSLGGYPSPNLKIASRFYAPDSTPRPETPIIKQSGSDVNATDPAAPPSVDEVLDAVAKERYGNEGASLARKAWTAFSTAFREFPYYQTVLYNCPVQIGPANPLYPEKTGYHATMTGIPYDDLTAWRGPYPAEVFATQFEKIAAGWLSGIPSLKAAVNRAPENRRSEVKDELRFAQTAYVNFQSVANQTRFVLYRDALADPLGKLSPDERRRLKREVRRCLESEIALARQLFLLTSEDSRIGYEAANQYFYLPLDLVEKVVNCCWLLDRYERD